MGGGGVPLELYVSYAGQAHGRCLGSPVFGHLVEVIDHMTKLSFMQWAQQQQQCRQHAITTKNQQAMLT